MNPKAMPPSESYDNKDEWVWVTIVRKETSDATDLLCCNSRRLGDEDDNEFNNLSLIVTFAKLHQQEELLGRFERCTESDILWYRLYAGQLL